MTKFRKAYGPRVATAVIDCSVMECETEQAHKDTCDIHNIINY